VEGTGLGMGSAAVAVVGNTRESAAVAVVGNTRESAVVAVVGNTSESAAASHSFSVGERRSHVSPTSLKGLGGNRARIGSSNSQRKGRRLPQPTGGRGGRR